MGLTIYVDLNGVLHDRDHPLPGKRMGEPILGAKESMEAMKAEGHTLVVFTDMAAGAGLQTVMDWLNYYGIPHDRITNVKGKLDVLIDDKAIRFDSWGKTLVELRRIELQGEKW